MGSEEAILYICPFWLKLSSWFPLGALRKHGGIVRNEGCFNNLQSQYYSTMSLWPRRIHWDFAEHAWHSR